MKLRTLAATIALLQIGSVVLPTAVALADDERGRGHNREQRGNDRRDRNHEQYRGDDRGRNNYPREQVREERRDNRRGDNHYRGWERPDHDYNRGNYRGRIVLPFHHGPNYYVPEGRIRYYRDIPVVRPYGHFYSGYGRYEHDDDALPFLAFAAISLVILNAMNENQQRALEDAQIRATRTPIGVPIQWNNGNAYGSVTPLRDGNDDEGRYCREFQQKVKVGGKVSNAYGTACRQPDGTWQIISTR